MTENYSCPAESTPLVSLLSTGSAWQWRTQPCQAGHFWMSPAGVCERCDWLQQDPQRRGR